MGNRILAGRYELIDMIGNGGMAVVYKAKDRLLNRFVAIKILKPNYSKDAKFIENFRRESRAAASLSHPNVVGIFDVGWEGNINYIVMELVEGKSLADLIAEKGKLSPRDAVTYAKQIAAALSHAHEHGIIHRDVKPHNVLITSENVAKLTDFGIAKAADMGTMVGNTGTVLGSVHYLSPEQARGGYVDEKTDIYSLGIVLYEMLTGKVPFDAENPVAVALMHVNEEIEPPTSIVPDIPQEIEDIVMKATQKYPVMRYKSADEMLEALQNASLAAIGIVRTDDGYEKAERFVTDDTDRSSEPKGTDDPTEPVPIVNRRNTGETKKSEDGENKRLAAILGSMGAKGDNQKMKKKKKKEKKQRDGLGILVRIFAILLAILVSLPISKAVAAKMAEKDVPTEVPVPSLAGKTVEEATTELEKLGLKLAIGTEVSSYDYDAGQIVSQTPKAENIVKVGNTVTVNVSKGILAGTVPSVVGQTLEGAAHLLQQNGYTAGTVSYDNSDTVPEGKVLRQSPAAGETVSSGTTVNLVISRGKADTTVKVPDIRLTDKTGAVYALDAYGLVLGKVEYEPSNNVPEGKIIRQSIEPGERAEAGTKIDVVMSSGPDESGGGNEINLVIDLSGAEKASFTLTVKLLDTKNNVSQTLPGVEVKKSDKTYSVAIAGEGTAKAYISFDDVMAKEADINFDTGTVTWTK